ncbi:MAG: SxtJ family membrane protein [Gammaproteobacteria bacterium]|nr:SxtJ family membrane protein [Gammaproteobacteria bacterium]
MKKASAIHEDFSRGEEPIKGSSDRGVGLVFATVFSIIGLWPLLSGAQMRIWALAVAGALIVLAIGWPATLAPLNRVWAWVGRQLHRIVNPVIMGILFYGTVTPTALVLKLLGKDPLKLRFDPKAGTYWIERRPPGPAPDTMRNQF